MITPVAQNQTYVFVGLGNPGLRYEMTRHNMGFMVIKSFAAKLGWILKEEKRFNALVYKGIVDGASIHLVMPLTYMNLSGEALRSYLDYYKLNPEGVVVITDDIAISFGQMRLKTAGSAGGHNGLKSIEQHLGTSSYKRLRMGIGSPDNRLVDYVLEPFNPEEMKELTNIVDRGQEVLYRMIKEDISRLMETVNRVPKAVKVEKELKDITKPPLQGEEKTHESTKTKPL